MATSKDQPVDLVSCRYCKHPLPPGASKCTECGSFQDWHRFLGFSASVLGLLVALVSVLTFALPIWDDQLDEKAMNPKFVMLDVDQTGMTTFAVSNAGDAPAALQMIAIARGNDVAVFDLRETNPDDALIEPGEIQVMRLSLLADPDEMMGLESLIRLFGGSDGPCAMQANFIDAQGRRVQVDVAIPEPGVEDEEDEMRGQCRFEIWSVVVATLTRMDAEERFRAPMCAISRKLRLERGEEPDTEFCAEVLRSAGGAAP